MASSAEDRRHLAHPQLYDCPPNSHVFWYGAQENKRRYGGYVYNPSHQRRTTTKSRFVTHFEGHWHLLQHRQGDLFPYRRKTTRTSTVRPKSTRSFVPIPRSLGSSSRPLSRLGRLSHSNLYRRF